MPATIIHLFRKAAVCFVPVFLLLIVTVPFQGQAQQSAYPFSLDLNFGEGLIGDPNVNTVFQPQLGFSYIPDKWGVGLNAGFLSYNPSFDAEQYAAGFEEYTSVTKSGEKWSSFFIGIGPRVEFGSRLPVTFRTSLDLALTYNSPPEASVDFADPTGSSGGAQLQLSGFSPGDNYNRWSTALRPEFQIQFSPGGSDLIAINLTAGIQHRLTKNEFTYSQKDLSKVRKADRPEEMFFQFNNAPDIQRTAHPPQTNFFSSVGIKIRFGKSGSQQLHSKEVIHRDIAARNVSRVQGGGDCDDEGPCPHPGDKASQATDYNSSRSNTEGIVNPGGGGNTGSDSTAAPATDYNSSRSNTEGIVDNGGGNDSSSDSTVISATDYNSSRSNTTSSASRASYAQDYNSSRSNRPRTRSAAGGDVGPIRWMAPELIIASGAVSSGTNPLYEGEVRGGENPVYEGEMNDSDDESDVVNGIQTYKLAPVSSCLHMTNTARSQNPGQSNSNNTESSGTKASQATDYNSSRSNTEGIVNPDGGNDTGSDSTAAPATDYNSSRSNTTSSIMGDPGNGSAGDTTATATDYNSSRSNTTSSIIGDPGNGSPGDTTATATSHNASRSNRSSGIINDGSDNGDIDADVDSTNVNPATSHNASRSNRSSGITDSGLGGDGDGDGFPDVMKNAEFSISKRSARTQRGSEEETGFHFNLMINDPDSDDDGLMDLTGASTFSISQKTSGTGKRKGNPLYSDDGAAGSNPLYEYEGAVNDGGTGNSGAGPVRMWTYNLGSFSDAGGEETGNLLKGAVLTIIHQNGRWHYDLQLNPDLDTDQDGFGDTIRNSSFSISKRSARTGR